MTSLYSIKDVQYSIETAASICSANELLKSTTEELLYKLHFSNKEEVIDYKKRVIKQVKIANKEIADKQVAGSLLLSILEIFFGCLGFTKLRHNLEPLSIKKIEQVFEDLEKKVQETPSEKQFWNKKSVRRLNIIKSRYRKKFISKFPEEQRKTVRKLLEIRSKYESNPEKEIARLTKAGIMTSRLKSITDSTLWYTLEFVIIIFSAILPVVMLLLIAKAIDTLIRKFLCVNNIQISLGRLLEIKHELKDTHYVFSHGQGLSHTVLNDLIMEFTYRRQRDKHNPMGSTFRKVDSVKYPNSNDFLSKNKEINDSKLSAELLSVDADSWNTSIAESSLYFSKTNGNISEGEVILNKVLLDFFPNKTDLENKICKHLVQKALDISSVKKCSANIGALYPIIIPKAIIDNPKTNFSYQAFPYGKEAPESFKWKLEQVQDDNIHISSAYVQYRLLTDCLAEETAAKRVFALQNTPLNHSQYHLFREKIILLVSEAEVYSKLLSLTKDSTQEEINEIGTQIKKLKKAINQDLITEIIENHKKNGINIQISV